MLFGELLAIRRTYQGRMQVLRRGHAQCGLQQDLARRVVGQVFAAYHMGDALVGVVDGKAAITVAATPDMAGKVNAADLARDAVIAMGGKGAGGKPDFAQGGAPDGSKAEDGLNAIRAALKG